MFSLRSGPRRVEHPIKIKAQSIRDVEEFHNSKVSFATFIL
jgi:hypothetical protein